VIVIIGILATLLSAVALGVLRNTEDTVIATEITDFEAGLVCVQNELGHGLVPPSTRDEAILFFKAAYPLCANPGAGIPATFGPDTALVFWLQGPNRDGFSANPENPFEAGGTRVGPFCELKESRIDTTTGKYYQDGADMTVDAPYVYYSSNGGYVDGVAMKSQTTGQFMNSGTYQIRAPGADGKLGTATTWPITADKTDSLDDISNYSDGKRFEKACDL